MKKLTILHAALVLVLTFQATPAILAQAPTKMSYQAVVRNSSNTLVTNQNVGMRISILQGAANGTPVYIETQTPLSNTNGLVSLEIGNGTVVSGSFANINWANGPYFIQTESDPNGGNAYSISGVSQLLSVPYALYAETSGSSTPGPQGPIGLTGPQGIAGLDGKTILHGSAAPTVGLGTNGDFYISTSTNKLYGPKTAGAWSTSINLIGPAGPGFNDGTQAGQMLYWNGTEWINIATGNGNDVLTFINNTPVWQKPAIPTVGQNDVYNHATGKVWMNRNLGASQVATSSTDPLAFGDLYQWGRGEDGHQIRTSTTITGSSNTDTPGNSSFYIAPGVMSFNWRNPVNNNLWQGVSGVNNPCPTGYRIPTLAELNAERLSWSSNNAAGAFASPLKWTVAGYRTSLSGSLMDVGVSGFYWSNTTDSNQSYQAVISATDANALLSPRAHGRSVRCIKD